MHLDEDVAHTRLPQLRVSLAGHDADRPTIELVVVQILQSLYGCTKRTRLRTIVYLVSGVNTTLPSVTAW